MIEPLFQVLATALSIWDHKEKTKYLDQYLDLRRRYDEALLAPDDTRDDAVICSLERELRLLAFAWTAAAQGQGAGTRS